MTSTPLGKKAKNVPIDLSDLNVSDQPKEEKKGSKSSSKLSLALSTSNPSLPQDSVVSPREVDLVPFMVIDPEGNKSEKTVTIRDWSQLNIQYFKRQLFVTTGHKLHVTTN